MKIHSDQDSIQSEKIQINVSEDLSETYVLKEGQELTIRKDYVFQLPNIESKVQIKAVIPSNAVFEFYPKVAILKGAFNTNTNLNIRCLLISESAKAIVEPAMEINEESVKAGHGATIGFINEEDISYLMSRGITRDLAIQLIINAFIN